MTFIPRNTDARARSGLIRWSMMMMFFLILVSATFSWNPPAPLVNSPQSAEDQKHTVSFSAKVKHDSPHVYIIQHAIQLLEKDGYGNWASGAFQYLQALTDGTRWPDKLGEDVNILIKLWITVPFPIKVKTWSIYLCNLASLEHYYNPDRPSTPGLYLSYWKELEKYAKLNGPLLSFLGAGLLGLDAFAFSTVDLEPELQAQYDSAGDVCEEFYQKAVDAWNGKISPETGRTYEETAMFYLGCALHLLSDVSIVTHTYDTFVGNHQKYEDYADKMGADDSATASVKYHATQNGFYNSSLSAEQFVAALAKKVHNYTHFQWVEGQGASTASGADLDRTVFGCGATDWGKALSTALPLAEKYSAGLIAKFFTEVKIPSTTQALTGSVTDSISKAAIPAAYVFYRKAGTKTWNHVRADGKGKFKLNYQTGKIEMRPAMPGYNFEGKYIYMSQGGPSEAFGVGTSPVPYTFPQFASAGDIFNFHLTPLPKEALIVGILDLNEYNKTAAETALLDADSVRARMNVLVPAPLLEKSALKKDTLLKISNSKVSAKLAENVNKALLQLSSMSTVVLAADKSGLPLPSYADFSARIYHYVDLNTGQVVTTEAQLVNAVDMGAVAQFKIPSRQAALGNKLEDLKAESPENLQTDQSMLAGLKIVEERMDLESVSEADGTSALAVAFPKDTAFGNLSQSLLAHGLVPVPSAKDVELEISIVPSEGFLGSALVEPLKLKTNSEGLVYFRLFPGTHAGKVRLSIKVTDDPLVEYDDPSTSTELTVYPRAAKDVTPRVHPYLVSLMPVFAEIVPGAFESLTEKARVQPELIKKVEPVAKPELEIDRVRPRPEIAGAGPGLHLQIVAHDERGVIFPVRGARVEVVREGAMFLSGESDEAGLYSVRLELGGYMIVVSAPGFAPQEFRAEYDQGGQTFVLYQPRPEGPAVTMARTEIVHWVFLDRGGERERPVREFPRERLREEPERRGMGALEVRVSERMGEGQLRPLPGARIEVRQGDRTVQAGMSGDSGFFRTEPLPQGIYQLFAMKEGYNRVGMDVDIGDRDAMREVVLVREREGGEERGRQDERIPIPPAKEPPREERWGNINFQVMENIPRIGFRPVPDARVIVTRGGQNVAAGDANNQGVYGLRLAYGDYRIQVTAGSRYEAYQADLAVSRDNETKQIVLKRKG